MKVALSFSFSTAWRCDFLRSWGTRRKGTVSSSFAHRTRRTSSHRWSAGYRGESGQRCAVGQLAPHSIDGVRRPICFASWPIRRRPSRTTASRLVSDVYSYCPAQFADHKEEPPTGLEHSMHSAVLYAPVPYWEYYDIQLCFDTIAKTMTVLRVAIQDNLAVGLLLIL